MFEGISSAQPPNAYNNEPADVQLAVGAGDVVQMVNTQVRIWTTAGQQLETIDLKAFAQAGDNLADPRVEFDALSGRWLAAVMDNTPGHYGVYVAASLTSDPTGAWWSGFWSSRWCLDQPRIGVSSSVVAFTANTYRDCVSHDSPLMGGQLWVLNKAELLAGKNIDYAYVDPDHSLFSLSPVQSLTPADVQYMAQIDSGSFKLVTLTGTPPDTVSQALAARPIMPITEPTGGVQPDTAVLLDEDFRTLDAVWKDGTLWAAANDACFPQGDSMPRSCVRVLAARTSPFAIVDDRDLSVGPGMYVFYPAIRPDGQGNLDVVFGYSSQKDYASVGVVSKPVAGPWGTWFSLAKGTAANTSGRWGDYFAAANDPSAPERVWVSGTYSASVPGTDAGYGWRTIVGAISAGAAPSVSYSAPSSTNVSSTSATLLANVNPQGSATSYWFEYETTTAYGSATAKQSLAASTSFQAVSAQVTGLTPGTTYHFRLTATNAGGTTYGIDQTFTTPAAVDRTPPRVVAKPSTYRAGRVSRLLFTLVDNSKEARVTEKVYSGSTLIKSLSTDFVRADGSTYYVTWTPGTDVRGALRHCARAWDRAGNASALSCSGVRPG